MAAKNLIRVSEFEKLYFDDDQPFKKKHWNVLCRYLEKVNKNEEKRVEYFRILNKGIQFTNFVGVIQAGNLTIEVLPKIDKGGTTAANTIVDDLEQTVADEKQKWQKVLLQMLKECRLLRINHVDYANLNLKSNSILDIYLELFLIEAESLLREGLLKKYRKEEGNQTALKGQLVFSKHISYNSTHQERFYVRHTEYNRNNIYNQLLFQALCLIPKLSNSGHLSDKVGRLLLDFPEVSKCKISTETFEKLVFDRKTERYKEALLIAKMLLLNYRPDITGGTDSVIAILFDMNKLWEEFVYRRLKREEANFKINVTRQASADFWNSEQLSKPKTIRPDVVIKTSGDQERTIVLDTKWKVLDSLVPSDEDLKQMFSYNLYWQCEKSVLIYPSQSSAEGEGSYEKFTGSPEVNTCKVATVCVISPEHNNLDKEIGAAILNTCIEKSLLSKLKR